MDAIDCYNNVKVNLYSCYSYYSKKVMGLDSYLDFEAARASFEQ